MFPVEDQPGPLYLLATDSELKRLLMELTGELLQNDSLRKVRAARKVGINIGPENEKVWVFSPKSVVSAGGRLLDADTSPVMWLERPINTTNILINSSLSCSIETPLDDGEAFRNLCYEIQCFMPENFLPTLASMSACVMAASYQQVIASCGCIGVPLLYGVPGSCKSEALKCGLALFGAQKSHLFNSQTTSSFLFQALTQTTIPIGIDDISEKAQETWEEMVIDLYNNTPRGTRSYQIEKFSGMPVLTSNWRFGGSQQRAYTRLIPLQFFEHSDEPDATYQYTKLDQACRKVSKSVAKIIQICSTFCSEERERNDEIFPQVSQIFCNSHVRFKTTFTAFTYFFLEVWLSNSRMCT